MIEKIKRDVEMKLIGIDVSPGEVYDWVRYLIGEVERLKKSNELLLKSEQVLEIQVEELQKALEEAKEQIEKIYHVADSYAEWSFYKTIVKALERSETHE